MGIKHQQTPIPDHWQIMMVPNNKKNNGSQNKYGKKGGWWVIAGPLREDGRIDPIDKVFYSRTRNARKRVSVRAGVPMSEVRSGEMQPATHVRKQLQDIDDEPEQYEWGRQIPPHRSGKSAMQGQRIRWSILQDPYDWNPKN